MSFPAIPHNPYGQQPGPSSRTATRSSLAYSAAAGIPGYPQGGPVPGMPPFAGWGARAGATLIDCLIAGLLPLMLIGVGYARFISAVVDASGNCTDLNCPAPDFPAAPSSSCHRRPADPRRRPLLCYREGSTGQTPGKKALGIRVLREVDGSRSASAWRSSAACATGWTQLACYIGYLWPLWDEKKQTFSDKIMHTVVVKPQ